MTTPINFRTMNKIANENTQEIQELLIRMERNNNLVQRLWRKLNSYTCEPNNRSCFEKLDTLKRSFRSFKEQQNRLLQELHQRKEQAAEIQDQIRLHLRQFKDLESEIAAYILSTKNYQ